MPCLINSLIKLEFLRCMVASPVRGGVMWPRARALGNMAPAPFCSPSPAKWGRGKGERDELRSHGCRRGLNYLARHGGLTYATNFG